MHNGDPLSRLRGSAREQAVAPPAVAVDINCLNSEVSKGGTNGRNEMQRPFARSDWPARCRPKRSVSRVLSSDVLSSDDLSVRFRSIRIIIRLRMDNLGSNPTWPTKSRLGSRISALNSDRSVGGRIAGAGFRSVTLSALLAQRILYVTL